LFEEPGFLAGGLTGADEAPGAGAAGFGGASLMILGPGGRLAAGSAAGFGSAGEVSGAGAAAAFGFGGAWVAVPPPFFAVAIACRAAVSSTLEAATLASIPAALSATRTSFELMFAALAIS
jgi:hypothetical protein